MEIINDLSSEKTSGLIRKKSKFNRADFYIWVYILYQLQDIFYPAGIINQALLIIFFFLSFFIGGNYFLLSPHRPILINSTALILWMYVIYGGLYFLSPVPYTEKDTPIYFYLLNSLVSLLPIFAFYNLFINNYCNENKIKTYVFVLLALYILQFYRTKNSVINNFAEEGIFSSEFTNNTGYSFLTLFPLFLLFKKSIIKYSGILISSFFILSSFKRGAILISSFCLIFIFIFEFFSNTSNKRRILSLFIILATIFTLVWYVSDLYNDSDYFKDRIEATEEGNSSNRDLIYSEVGESYLAGNFFQQIFGRGADSTFLAAQTYAHQDWLETLHNNGLLGAILLLFFYISIFISIRNVRKSISPNRVLAFYILFIICFLKSMFSMSIQVMELTVSLMLGYLAFTNYKYNNPKLLTDGSHKFHEK